MAKIDVNQPVFLDTNFLLRTIITTTQEHTLARDGINRLWNSGTEIWISRQILREYMAVVTRPQTFMSVLSGVVVANQIRQLEQQFKIAEDSPLVTAQLLTLIETISIGGKQIHDANIVATMQVYNIRQLLTFNGVDFTRFTPQIEVIAPQDVS